MLLHLKSHTSCSQVCVSSIESGNASLVSADDFGKIHLFRYPAINKEMVHKTFIGRHSSIQSLTQYRLMQECSLLILSPNFLGSCVSADWTSCPYFFCLQTTHFCFSVVRTINQIVFLRCLDIIHFVLSVGTHSTILVLVHALLY